MIDRSNRNRLRLAKNIDYWLGMPVATQCDYWDQLYSIQSTYIWSLLNFKFYLDYRDDCRNEDKLATRARKVVTYTGIFFAGAFMLRFKKKFRRTFYVWLGLSYFHCPEWPMAYI